MSGPELPRAKTTACSTLARLMQDQAGALSVSAASQAAGSVNRCAVMLGMCRAAPDRALEAPLSGLVCRVVSRRGNTMKPPHDWNAPA